MLDEEVLVLTVKGEIFAAIGHDKHLTPELVFSIAEKVSDRLKMMLAKDKMAIVIGHDGELEVRQVTIDAAS